MALETIVAEVYLDVYDHDTTPSVIKTIALDNQTRIVRAYLQRNGEVYQPDQNATVTLTALRPDKIGVEGDGEVVELVPASGDDPAVYGLQAEITQAMIAVSGMVLFQFKMEVGEDVLRTEIFTANNGRALDGDASGWAGEYQGYNLDELAEKIDFMGMLIDQALQGTITLDRAILETHRYTERYVNGRLDVKNNALHINTNGEEGESEDDERVWIVDNTLTLSGAAADAKTTGDKFDAIESDLSETSEQLTSITGIHYTTVNGYLDGSGVIQPQTTGTPKEVTTNRFKVVEGAKIHIDFNFTSNALMWIVYCCWNKNGTFLGRTYLVNSVSQKAYSNTITVPNGAVEIAFSWRTYSMATCSLSWAYSIYGDFFGLTSDAVSNTDDLRQLIGIETMTSIVPVNVKSKTVNGITFTVDSDDGTVTANGTATAGAFIDIPFIPIKSGIYWLTGAPAGSVTSKWYQIVTGGTAYETGDGASYPLTAGTLYNIRIVVQKGKTADNLVFMPRLVYRERGITRNNAVRGQWLFTTNPYYDHLFIETVGSNDAAIPCQSIWHISVSKRLGFEVIETNTQQTSDGKYVVMHGVSGTFGQAFYATNGDDIADTLVSEVTSDYIKTYVRFNSTYEKYRTPPSTVEEWLHEVKAHGLIPLVDCHFDDDLISVVDGIMGDGNYIAYNANRAQTNATIMRYLSITSASMARFNCRKYESPFMLCIANASSLSDAVLTEIIEACHAEGCYAGFAGSYETVLNNIRYIDLGMDFCASNYQTPYNPQGNLLNMCGDISFADFMTDGSEADNKLTLADGQSISAGHSSAVPLASASLEINFVGTLIINFGRFISNVSYTSDGKKTLRITTYFRNSVPAFSLESEGTTVVNAIVFKANKA